jgi:hypothetical protein
MFFSLHFGSVDAQLLGENNGIVTWVFRLDYSIFMIEKLSRVWSIGGENAMIVAGLRMSFWLRMHCCRFLCSSVRARCTRCEPIMGAENMLACRLKCGFAAFLLRLELTTLLYSEDPIPKDLGSF